MAVFWDSPIFLKEIAPEDGHFKIHMWSKPASNVDRKTIFQLSSCFIQGGKISKIATQLNLPIETVQRFIAANIATHNLSKIIFGINILTHQKSLKLQKKQD